MTWPRVFLHPMLGAAAPWADFDLSALIFTPAMDKRSAPGPFDRAPICQGKWDGTGTPDIVTAGRGNQIVDYFYEHIDPYQGTIVFWITPEWDGDDGIIHYVVRTGQLYVHKKSSPNRLVFGYRDATMWRSISIDASGWSAGDTHLIICRYDSNNSLDGTNHLCITVDGISTFGASTLSGARVPDSVPIGHYSSAESADAVIEGFTIYRRVLYDGTYGIDVGNGNELDAIYASGAGKDPCEVTGSWDVVFALPTDQVDEALQTTGEAWSHPHSSAKLTDGFCQTTYGSSAWSTVGTPSTGPADMADADKIFAWGYSWTSDAAGEGVQSNSATVIADTDYVIRVIAHCAQADDIRVVVWDETNNAQIGADFDFGASSSRTAPGVALFVVHTPATCTNMSVRVQSTAAGQTIHLHQAEVYESLLPNGDMESGAGNPWIPTGWTNIGLNAGDTEAEAGTVHSGLQSMEWNVGATDYENLVCGPPSLSAGDYVAMGGWQYGDGTEGLRIGFISNTDGVPHSVYDTEMSFNMGDAASWQHTVAVYRIRADNPTVRIVAWPTPSGDRFLDDIYLIALDPVTLTVTPASKDDSQEGIGIRIDGRDTGSQPVPTGVLSANYGDVRWSIQPRHDDTEMVSFGNTTPMILRLWGDANNYIDVRFSAADTVQLRFNAAGAGEQSDTWATGGSYFTPGSTYRFRIVYSSSRMQLFVDGTLRITINATTGFSTVPATVYWGSDQNGEGQIDAVYGPY